MQKWVYDIEVSPNFFCASFYNIDTKEVKTFVIFGDKNDAEELEAFLSQEMFLIGFNNLYYDGLVIAYLLETMYQDGLNRRLFDFSSEIINSDRYAYNPELNKYRYPETAKYVQIDLMKIMAFDKLGVSLKQCAISLRWDRIQDLPFDYDHLVRDWDEVKIFIDYNINDVLISNKLYETILPLIELREKLGSIFGVNLLNASDSKMANVILEKFYEDELGLDVKAIRYLRTDRDHFMLSDCVAPNIEFKTNYLRRIKYEIENTPVRKLTKFKFSKKINFAGVDYELGVGGLHSVDFPALFVSSNRYNLIDSDIASFYPSMMIVNKIIPAHLGEDFVRVLERITKERLAAKKVDKVKADGLKITINSIFGKFGSDTFWLQDQKALLSVTVSGQLYLLMLIEAFVLSGIEVISANTDGVVVRCPVELEGVRQDVCREWERKTGFILEDTFYSKYARSDVNNYLTKKTNGESKAKGRYVKEIDIKKAYRHPIVPRAMYEFLANGTPIEETILSCQDILDFCISQKSGSKFQMEYRHDTGEVEYLQKNNRFYVSNSGGELVKKDKTKDSEIGLYVGQKLRILNVFQENIPFEEYDVKFNFYIDEAKKYIDEIFLYEKEFEGFLDEPEGVMPEINSKARDEVLLKIHGMKNISDKTVAGLLKVRDIESTFSNFLDLLVYAEENRIFASKYKELILTNYFSNYGSQNKLMQLYNEFTDGKNRYQYGHSDKTKEKRLTALLEFWNGIPEETISIRDQLNNEFGILGRFQTKFNVPSRWAYVNSVAITEYPNGETSSPKVDLYFLRKGVSVVAKVPKKFFGKRKLSEGDFVYCDRFEERERSRPLGDGTFEKIAGTKEWWLLEYNRGDGKVF